MSGHGSDGVSTHVARGEQPARVRPPERPPRSASGPRCPGLSKETGDGRQLDSVAAEQNGVEQIEPFPVFGRESGGGVGCEHDEDLAAV